MSIVQQGLLYALCAPFVIVGWIAFTHGRLPAVAVIAPSDGTGDANGGSARTPARLVEIETAVCEAVAALYPWARALGVRIDIALCPDMRVHVDPGALGMALRLIMMTAIQSAPGGQVLITGLGLGTQGHIRVTDDGAGASQRDREGLVREAASLIALQGGSIAVEARPGRGTTVAVRLPLPGEVKEESVSRQPVYASVDA